MSTDFIDRLIAVFPPNGNVPPKQEEDRYVDFPRILSGRLWTELTAYEVFLMRDEIFMIGNALCYYLPAFMQATYDIEYGDEIAFSLNLYLTGQYKGIARELLELPEDKKAMIAEYLEIRRSKDEEDLSPEEEVAFQAYWKRYLREAQE